MKIELSAAEAYKLEKAKQESWFSRACAVQKKIWTPESNSTGNFLWGTIRKKNFIVKCAFARKINEHKFLKN